MFSDLATLYPNKYPDINGSTPSDNDKAYFRDWGEEHKNSFKSNHAQIIKRCNPGRYIGSSELSLVRGVNGNGINSVLK